MATMTNSLSTTYQSQDTASVWQRQTNNFSGFLSSRSDCFIIGATKPTFSPVVLMAVIKSRGTTHRCFDPSIVGLYPG